MSETLLINVRMNTIRIYLG